MAWNKPVPVIEKVMKPFWAGLKSHRFLLMKCDECGAKIYPGALLQPHITRHQRRQRWFVKELRKLQYTMAHMRDLA